MNRHRHNTSNIISTLISGLIEQKYNLPVITVITGKL